MTLLLLDSEICSIMHACKYMLRLRTLCQRWHDVFDDECPQASKRLRLLYQDCDIPKYRWMGFSMRHGDIGYTMGAAEYQQLVLSRLPFIHTLSLVDCPFTNAIASSLGNVKCLTLCHCHGITDVSALGKVRRICLWDCRSITDVSALGTVKRLDLLFCHGITDVSALGTVKHLQFNRCDGIVDVSALGTVKRLEIYKCNSITDVSALKNVPDLTIRDCRHVADVRI